MIRLAALATLLLAGCAPQRLVVTKPVPVTETRTVVEKVDPALCGGDRTMPTGPLSSAPQVAAQRRDKLETAWGQLDAICDRHAK
jgi:hypothetical protein